MRNTMHSVFVFALFQMRDEFCYSYNIEFADMNELKTKNENISMLATF